MRKVYLASVLAASAFVFYSCGESKPEVPAEFTVNELSFTLEKDGELVKLENGKTTEGTSQKMGEKQRTEIEIKGDNAEIKLMFNFDCKSGEVGEYDVSSGLEDEKTKKCLIAYGLEVGEESSYCCGYINDDKSSGKVKITYIDESNIAGEIDATNYDGSKVVGKFYSKIRHTDYD